MRNSVFTYIDTAYLLNLLYLKGHKYRHAFGGKGTQGIYLSMPYGNNRIESVKLLVFHNRKLTKVFPSRSKQGFGIGI